MATKTSSTSKSLPKPAEGCHGVALPTTQPSPQLAIVYDVAIERENDEKALRDLFRAAVNAFGGADALRATLGEAPNYLSKITDAMVGTRPVQGRWLLPLLDDPRSAPMVATWINRRAGFASPAPTRVITREEIAETSLQIDLENPMMWRAKRPEIAKRLNCDIEDVLP